MNILNTGLEITNDAELITFSTATGGHLLFCDDVLFDVPAPAGHYNLAGCYIHLDEKPRRLHRFFARVLLGWEWVDYD